MSRGRPVKLSNQDDIAEQKNIIEEARLKAKQAKAEKRRLKNKGGFLHLENHTIVTIKSLEETHLKL